jgi:hypothetical protein
MKLLHPYNCRKPKQPPISRLTPGGASKPLHDDPLAAQTNSTGTGHHRIALAGRNGYITG